MDNDIVWDTAVRLVKYSLKLCDVSEIKFYIGFNLYTVDISSFKETNGSMATAIKVVSIKGDYYRYTTKL